MPMREYYRLTNKIYELGEFIRENMEICTNGEIDAGDCIPYPLQIKNVHCAGVGYRQRRDYHP